MQLALACVFGEVCDSACVCGTGLDSARFCCLKEGWPDGGAEQAGVGTLDLGAPGCLGQCAAPFQHAGQVGASLAFWGGKRTKLRVGGKERNLAAEQGGRRKLAGPGRGVAKLQSLDRKSNLGL